jgi:lipopolysaccharide transport system permease protein
MHEFSVTPWAMVASLWRHRQLISASVKRDILGRYRGSFLGTLWSFFNPLFMLAVYTFVFSVVFKARWGASGESKTEFALVLFAGLIVFNMFSECVSRAPTLILSNSNYVTKVVFPLEILPFIAVLAAIYHALVSFMVWIVAYVIFFGAPHLTIFLVPLIVWPFCLFILGVSWVLASLGVFLRDITQFIGIFITFLMFLSPLFYPASALPEDYRAILSLNPLSVVIEMTRDVLYWGILPNFSLLIAFSVMSGMIAWLGFVWFQKTRRGFADVL